MKGYTNIKADDFCCIGAVLVTILVRNSYKKYSQYDIINEFDVVFGFDYGMLNNIPNYYGIGHVGLFLKLEGGNLLFLDPGHRNYDVRKVNICDLYNAIRNKSDGLWII